MKKLLVVLLSMALIAGFSATASALDFKLSGSYHAYGMYMNNPNLQPDITRFSRATIYTRTRMMPVLTIADGLTFTMRFDALEKKWGDTSLKDARYPNGLGQDDTTSSRRFPGNGRTQGGDAKLQENIEFERGYVTFKTAIGVWDVGYQQSGVWGTKGLQQDTTRPRIRLVSPFGPVSLIAIYEKTFEGGEAPATGGNAPTRANGTFTPLADADNDNYNLAFTYNNGKNLQGGLLYQFRINNSNRPANNSRTKLNLFAPYFQASFGPVFVEGEAMYFFGKAAEYDSGLTPQPADIDHKSLGVFLHAKMVFGPAYTGLQFHYASGDDLSDPNKSTTFAGTTTTWTPALMLLSDGMSDLISSTTTNGINQTSGKVNSIIYSGYAGFNLNPRLNFEIDVTYATAAQKALARNAVTGVVTDAVSDKMGLEVDLSATYKLYDNLTYTMAAGYLWTGDYFKGANAAAEVGNNYGLMNRLILAF